MNSNEVSFCLHGEACSAGLSSPWCLRLGWSDSHSIGPFVFGAEAGDHIRYVRAF